MRKARAAVRSSTLGATGDSMQRAIASNTTAPALSVYPGYLAYRQRVKRFRTARAAVGSSALDATGDGKCIAQRSSSAD